LVLRSSSKDAGMLFTYLIVLLITLGGMLQLSPMIVGGGALLLFFVAIGERRGPLSSNSRLTSAHDEPFASMADMLTSAAAASAAFLLGRATAWIWGL